MGTRAGCFLPKAQKWVEANSIKELRTRLHCRREWPHCGDKDILEAVRRQVMERGVVRTFYVLHCPRHDPLDSDTALRLEKI